MYDGGFAGRRCLFERFEIENKTSGRGAVWEESYK